MDLCKLTELCFNICKEVNEEKEKVKNEKGKHKTLSSINNKKINDELEHINKSIDMYMKEQSFSFLNYFNENFLKMSKYVINNKRHFEWCNKTYNNCRFGYKLSNNNSKGTKIKSCCLTSILRSKEKLENNFIYKIKFKIGIIDDGRFDIGISKEQSSDFYYLGNNESLCFSTKGLLVYGERIGECYLKNNDIIDLEICTKIGNKTFKGSVNNKSVYSFDFDLDDIYIMASMNRISSYIEVLEYYVIPL